MKYRVLITSLPSEDPGEGIRYYRVRNGLKNVYCDALTAAEACSKYILSTYRIDSIVTFGSRSTYDDGDESRAIPLSEGSDLYASDFRKMSTFSLYRYRLAEFLDEINSEVQDIRELLSPEEQAEAERFIKTYFREKVNTDRKHKMNRFFDRLVRDKDLLNDMAEERKKVIPVVADEPERFDQWVRHYLYDRFRDSGKMELLEGNEDVDLRFVTSAGKENDREVFVDTLLNNLRLINDLLPTDREDDELELYLCLNNDNAINSLIITTLMDTIRYMPGTRTNIARVITTGFLEDTGIGVISDDTEIFGVTDILAGARAFLTYGKADILIDYWTGTGISNPAIERIIYAMRNIDTGISLCDISDIERGMNTLRTFFANNQKIDGNTFPEKYFNIIIGVIRQDYGSLLTGDHIEFMDLVKWAYRKGFWQQTLTLIESRAPGDFVKKGFFYYCDSQSSREKAVRILGEIYYALKAAEKHKFRDVDHYYIKFYSRRRVVQQDNKKMYQMSYTRTRIRELSTEEDDLIRALTVCPDKNALSELLFSYYYLGDIRNAINHAQDEFGGFAAVMDDSDFSERMNTIAQSIEYFIHCYDKVREITPDPEEQILRIQTDELEEYAVRLKMSAQDKKKGGKKEGNSDDKSGSDEEVQEHESPMKSEESPEDKGSGTEENVQPVSADQTVPDDRSVPDDQSVPDSQPGSDDRSVPGGQSVPGDQPVSDDQTAEADQKKNGTRKKKSGRRRRANAK